MTNTKEASEATRPSIENEIDTIRRDAKEDHASETFARWFAGDLAYATLPLMVLATINVALRVPFDDFLLIKEWSFASIVIFGVCIRKLVKLNIEQEIPGSANLDLSFQALIVLLISSVLTLSFVILNEKHKLTTVAMPVIGLMQLVLFSLSLYCLFSFTRQEQGTRLDRKHGEFRFSYRGETARERLVLTLEFFCNHLETLRERIALERSFHGETQQDSQSSDLNAIRLRNAAANLRIMAELTANDAVAVLGQVPISPLTVSGATDLS